MSITSRISSMEEHVTNAYNGLQGLGADLTNVNKNIENISMVLDDIYDSLPSVSGEGTSLTLDDTRVGKIKSTLKGNTSQDGTPTPDNPIPVNVVSGDNEINVCGKNLYNSSDTTYYSACTYVSGANTNQYKIKATGTDMIINAQTASGSSYSSSAGTLIPCKYGETIYYDIGNSNFGKNYVTQYDTNKVSLGFSALNTGSSSGSYTPTNSNCKYISIRIGYGSTTSGTEYTLAPIFSKVSNLTYEPYQGNTYNIDLPVENLFNKTNANTLTCLLNGTNGQIVYFDTAKLLYIPCNSNTTYTISKIKSARFVVGTSSNIPANGVICNVYQANNNATSITITSGINDNYISVFYYLNGTDTLTEQQIIDSIQIEVGNKANSYTPYGTTPIEMYKIGNYQDYFYKDSGKWYLHKEIGKVVLNGSEAWTLDNGTNPFYLANIISKLKAPTTSTVGTALCNKYVSTNIFSANTNKGFIILSNGTSQTNCRVREESMGTVEAFKTSLQNNNAIIYSIIATPTNEEITYQPLIDQLNLLEKAMSKDGQTNISQVNNDLPFEITASALKEWSV